MDCAETRENLVALLDGELSPEQRDRVESHLAGCPACRREQAALETTGDLLSLLGQREKSSLDLAGMVAEAAREGSPWCRHIRRELVAHLDGELSEAESRPVVEHLAEWEECAEEAGALAAVGDALPAWTLPRFDSAVADRVLARVRSPRRIRRLVVGLAAAVILLLAGGVVRHLTSVDPGLEPPEGLLRNFDLVVAYSQDPGLLDPELLDMADNLEWLDSISDEELAAINGNGG